MPDKTSMFDRAIPVLASLEIATSLDFFHKLGFETHDFGDHNYSIAIREHIEIHFWLCADKHVAENTSCYVRVNDIHALHADLAKRFDVGEIVETPWGMDELYVIDPSGSLVKFGQLTDRFIQADAVQEAPRACRSTAPSFCRRYFPSCGEPSCLASASGGPRCSVRSTWAHNRGLATSSSTPNSSPIWTGCSWWR